MDVDQALKELNMSSREELIFKLKELLIKACDVKDVAPEDIPTAGILPGGVREWSAR